MDRSLPSNDLVERAVSGDKVALKVVLTQTRRLLCERLARKIPVDLRRIVDVEDIMQEAHIDAFRRIHTFDDRGPDSFYRWIAKIAVNRLRDAIKKERALKRGGGYSLIACGPGNVDDSTFSLWQILVAKGRTPSGSMARVEAIAAVQEAIAALPSHYRQAVTRVHIEGRSVRETAASMDRTERAIHGLCRRGLRLLEAQLQSGSRYLSSTG